MNKYKTLAALVATALLATAGAASAQSLVQGGGASLPAKLYKGSADSILPANFSYEVTGSGTGKQAFLENRADLFKTTGTVHFAGSDSVLTDAEIAAYAANFAPTYGPLIQIPSVGTSVTVPFNSAGGNLDLSVTQLCGVFAGTITNWSTLDANRSGPITVRLLGQRHRRQHPDRRQVQHHPGVLEAVLVAAGELHHRFGAGQPAAV
ncbi:hypothetical protein G6F68_011486 [Rhizopus microsporus]|nr:hypothetical protein G6F68_011486 [Rhizopus microsporus]